MTGDSLYICASRRAEKYGRRATCRLPPTADSYVASFTEDKAEIIRTDGYFTTTLECVVSSEDNAEARRVTIANTGLTAREVELTSYAELVLAQASSDTAHPAFSKMFVETEYR